MNRRSELASLCSSLDELTKRITSLADEEARDEHSSLAPELFRIERAMREAVRRLRGMDDRFT